MPSSYDATISSLLDGLKKGTEQSRAAWLQLREVLQTEPERVAAQLCGWIDECLASGMTVPLEASIISAVMVCTKHKPDLVTEEVLRSLLSRAGQLTDLSLLCLASMLARVHPEGILTDGIFQVLVATEHALIEPRDESDREVQRYAKTIALELWRTVGARDAPSLVALLEIWTAKAGWQRHSSHLIAEILLEAIPRDPNILGDTIGVVESIKAKEQQSPGELEPPDRILNELKKLSETLRRKKIAERLAKEVLAGLAPSGPVQSPARFRDKPIVAPDPKVDRLIEEYLERPNYLERMEKAERRIAKAMKSGSMDEVHEEDITLAGSDPPVQRLFRAMSEPYPALVEGVCQLVDELIEKDPLDERIDTLVLQLCLVPSRHQDLIPADKFQRWVANASVFGDEIRAWLYDRLAALEPDWIVEHKLADAVSVSIVAKHTGFFSKIGVRYPGLLTAFVEQYILEVAWDRDTVPNLMRAMEEVARQRPEEAEAMIAVIERLRGEAPGPDVIDFRYIELSKTLDLLRSVGGKGKP